MKVEPATPTPECIEGREAFKRFDGMMGKLLSVSHETLVRREQEYQERAKANPNRPGPKPKVKRRRGRASAGRVAES
jgi:hypothetical protein